MFRYDSRRRTDVKGIQCRSGFTQLLAQTMIEWSRSMQHPVPNPAAATRLAVVNRTDAELLLFIEHPLYAEQRSEGKLRVQKYCYHCAGSAEQSPHRVTTFCSACSIDAQTVRDLIGFCDYCSKTHRCVKKKVILYSFYRNQHSHDRIAL